MSDKDDLKLLVDRLRKVIEDMDRILKDKDTVVIPTLREEKKKDVFHT